MNPIFDNSWQRSLGTKGGVLAGVFFQIVAAFARAGIAISLYPVLRKHSHGLALGSVGFRVTEGVLYIVNAIAALLLLTLSQAFVRHTGSLSSSLQVTGELLKEIRNNANLMGILAFYVGAAMYCYLFYRSTLIPRWLSAWGIAGA